MARTEWGPVAHGPPKPPPEGWVVATDGSGKVEGGAEKAGWGAVVSRWPVADVEPAYVLHAPVVTKP